VQVESAVPRPPSASGSRRSLRCFESSRPAPNRPSVLQGKKKGAEGRDETKGEGREGEGGRSQKGGVVDEAGRDEERVSKGDTAPCRRTVTGLG
jgi:hypothetical protein